MVSEQAITGLSLFDIYGTRPRLILIYIIAILILLVIVWDIHYYYSGSSQSFPHSFSMSLLYFGVSLISFILYRINSVYSRTKSVCLSGLIIFGCMFSVNLGITYVTFLRETEKRMIITSTNKEKIYATIIISTGQGLLFFVKKSHNPVFYSWSEIATIKSPKRDKQAK